MQLILSRAHIAQLRAWADESHPHECCGLLLGNHSKIATVRLARNVADDPARRFEIDPVVLIEAERGARRGEPAVIGYFHSHPIGLAKPSVTDAAMASIDGRFWLIIANGEVTAWVPVSSGDGLINFEAVTITVKG